MKLSIGQSLASAKIFWKRMSQVPTGFKNLFFETKDALVLYSKKRSQARSAKRLKRREEELIRSNFASVQKLIVYFFLQLPPIIGILPTIIYLRYPRQLLTRHFWSDDEFKMYVVEEYQERRTHAQKLSQLLRNTPSSLSSSSSSGSIPSSSTSTVVSINAPAAATTDKQSPIITYHLPLQLDHLSKEHIKTLAGANGICSTEFILNMAPSVLLKQWLKTRADEIALDDQLLAQEGVDELAPNDLQVACLRRGLNPCLNQMKTQSPTQLSEAVADSTDSHNRNSNTTVPTTTTTNSTAANPMDEVPLTAMNAVPSSPSNELAGQVKLREYLVRWINSPVAKHCRSTQPTPVSLLTHAAALPELFLDNTTFTSFPPTESTKE